MANDASGDDQADIREMVKRIPQWLRTDLAVTDPMLRERAEETLMAIIAALMTERRVRAEQMLETMVAGLSAERET